MVADGTLNLGQAATLAKQVRAKRSGSAPLAGARSAYLTSAHRLASVVRDACTHGETRTLIGGVGCGQCWEQSIQGEVRGDVVPEFDEAAVLRAVDGGVWSGPPMARNDRYEAVRRLVALGHLDGEIARRTGVTARQALRDRQTLRLASPEPKFAHTTERTAS